MLKGLPVSEGCLIFSLEAFMISGDHAGRNIG
jgi:hypothetical protein